ncbi:hypothetical protein FQA47_003276 [Oryzias melastigma]|uniref:Uncharacterized protein n=1 Tax=Oryzias melastigma TaxID=30732 RepID=A0A834F7M2_ORYME|nr:hypothetical protein FQA47_003276 [Oryzias melastigma]
MTLPRCFRPVRSEDPNLTGRIFPEVTPPSTPSSTSRKNPRGSSDLSGYVSDVCQQDAHLRGASCSCRHTVLSTEDDGRAPQQTVWTECEASVMGGGDIWTQGCSSLQFHFHQPTCCSRSGSGSTRSLASGPRACARADLIPGLRGSAPLPSPLDPVRSPAVFLPPLRRGDAAAARPLPRLKTPRGARTRTVPPAEKRCPFRGGLTAPGFNGKRPRLLSSGATEEVDVKFWGRTCAVGGAVLFVTDFNGFYRHFAAFALRPRGVWTVSRRGRAAERRLPLRRNSPRASVNAAGS